MTSFFPTTSHPTSSDPYQKRRKKREKARQIFSKMNWMLIG